MTINSSAQKTQQRGFLGFWDTTLNSLLHRPPPTPTAYHAGTARVKANGGDRWSVFSIQHSAFGPPFHPATLLPASGTFGHRPIPGMSGHFFRPAAQGLRGAGVSGRPVFAQKRSFSGNVPLPDGVRTVRIPTAGSPPPVHFASWGIPGLSKTHDARKSCASKRTVLENRAH